MVIKHIKPLTSMRFIFCFMVFLSHITTFFNVSETKSLKWLSFNIFREGYLGVSFFFILSGFILSYTYHNKLTTKLVSSKEFIINRITRIYPLHFLTLIVSLPLVLVSISSGLDFIIKSINFFINGTLIQSFVPVKSVYFGFNSPSWSISTEMFFYLLTPLLFNFLYKINNIKSIIIVLCISFFILIGINFTPEKYHHSIFYINPLIRIFDFIIGIVLFHVFNNNSSVIFSTLKSTFLETFSILLFIVFFYFHKDIPQVYRYSIYYWIPMIYIIYVFSKGNGIFSYILSKKWFVYLGEISFGFYLIHQLVIRYVSIIFRKLDINLDGLTMVFIILIVTTFLSILSFEFFENKVRKKFKIYLTDKLTF